MKKSFQKIVAIIIALMMLLPMLLAATARGEENEPNSGTQGTNATLIESGFVLTMFEETSGFVTFKNGSSKGIWYEFDGSPFYLTSSGTSGNIYFIDYSEEKNAVYRFSNGAFKALYSAPSNTSITALTYYKGDIYFLEDGMLQAINTTSSKKREISSQEMEEFAIVDGIIYYANSADRREYSQKNKQSDDETLTANVGKLYSMKLDGSDNSMLLDHGVSTISAHGNKLYFAYFGKLVQRQDEGETWLTGSYYSYSLDDYELRYLKADSAYQILPTDYGIVLKSQDEVLLLDEENLSKRLLFEPFYLSAVAVLGDKLLISEYDKTIKHTLLDLDSDDEMTLKWSNSVKATEKPTAKPTKKPASKDYIFPDSSKKKLTEDEILAVKQSLRSYGRNEMLARHGYTFKNKEYREYFEGKSWYKADKNYSADDVSSIEWYNMELIKKYEVSSGPTSKSEWIFKNSSEQMLTEIEVRELSRSLLPYARNEIYARNHYTFSKEIYRDYFNKKDWYEPKKNIDPADFTRLEWTNIQLIKRIEAEYNDPDGYVFAHSGDKLLTEREVRALDPDMLRFARNEILARHGYTIKNDEIREFFDLKDWYKPDKAYTTDRINYIEWKNIALIKKIEAENN